MKGKCGEGIEDEAWADVHYEHSGRFEGVLRYGAVTVALAGTGYRDHSVGPRDVEPMLAHTWVHGEFGSGRDTSWTRLTSPRASAPSAR